jgi:hypothetical protein
VIPLFAVAARANTTRKIAIAPTLSKRFFTVSPSPLAVFNYRLKSFKPFGTIFYVTLVYVANDILAKKASLKRMRQRDVLCLGAVLFGGSPV